MSVSLVTKITARLGDFLDDCNRQYFCNSNKDLFTDRSMHHVSEPVDVANDKGSVAPVHNAEVAQTKQFACHDLAL